MLLPFYSLCWILFCFPFLYNEYLLHLKEKINVSLRKKEPIDKGVKCYVSIIIIGNTCWVLNLCHTPREVLYLDYLSLSSSPTALWGLNYYCSHFQIKTLRLSRKIPKWQKYCWKGWYSHPESDSRTQVLNYTRLTLQLPSGWKVLTELLLEVIWWHGAIYVGEKEEDLESRKLMPAHKHFLILSFKPP